MNLQLTKKNVGIIVAAIIVIGLLIGVYFYFIYPLKKEAKTLENQLATEKKLYETMSAQVANTKNNVIENSRILQKRLPVESFIEQFILDLEKAEVVSNSLIEDMTFQEKEVSENDVTIDNDEEQDEGQQQNTGDVKESEGQSKIPGIPEGMNRVIVNLTVTSENYFDMYTFLETIEKLDRITKIDSLSIAGGEEILTVDQEIKELTYTVVLSTFYYPALTELKDELPAFEAPPPSKKDNPLPTGMYYEETKTKTTKTVENEQSVIKDIVETIIETKSSKEQEQKREEPKPVEEKKSVQKKAIMSGKSIENEPSETGQLPAQLSFKTHIVQKGDTLFSISMRYFNANRVNDIMKLNQLQNDQIEVGQKLKIPN